MARSSCLRTEPICIGSSRGPWECLPGSRPRGGRSVSRMCSLVLEEVHRSILGLLRRITSSEKVSSLLDVGCWDGRTTIEYAGVAAVARAYGIEVFEEPASQAAQRGVSVA